MFGISKSILTRRSKGMKSLFPNRLVSLWTKWNLVPLKNGS